MMDKDSCMICGGSRGLATVGGITLCRRCLNALYGALNGHFPLKTEGEYGKMDKDKNLKENG